MANKRKAKEVENKKDGGILKSAKLKRAKGAKVKTEPEWDLFERSESLLRCSWFMMEL